MQNPQGLGVQVVVDGKALPEYTKDGKTYIAAPWNSDYKLRFLVPTLPANSRRYKRFATVTSVDGLDIMTGKRATALAGGYVFDPAKLELPGVDRLAAFDVPGYRLNDKEVANFRFGDRSDSYAAQMDRPENVGVIGVILFSEYDPKPLYSDLYEGLGFGGGMKGGGGGSPYMMGGGCLGGMKGGGGGHDMGTVFGKRTEHRVSTTEFTRDREVARFTIEYASRESLIAVGVITEPPLGRVEPFAETGCTPPRGWKG